MTPPKPPPTAPAPAPAPSGLMPAGYFRLLQRSFGDSDPRRRALLAGLEAADTPSSVATAAEVDVESQLRQLDNLDALLGEGWVFCRPEVWSHASHGALGVAALTAPDLEGAMQIVAAYGRVRAPVIDFAARRGRRGLTLAMRYVAELSPARQRNLAQSSLSGVVSLVAVIIGAAPAGLLVAFRDPEPTYAEDARRALLCAVAWNGAADSVFIPAALLLTPSPFADPSLHARAREELETALARLERPGDLRPRLERLLVSHPAGRLTASAAARALGVSRRTLVRRLAMAGAGYRALLDAELRRRAAGLLDAGELSHAKIAERLGYAEPTSFSRACRRWFGRA